MAPNYPPPFLWPTTQTKIRFFVLKKNAFFAPLDRTQNTIQNQLNNLPVDNIASPQLIPPPNQQQIPHQKIEKMYLRFSVSPEKFFLADRPLSTNLYNRKLPQLPNTKIIIAFCPIIIFFIDTQTSVKCFIPSSVKIREIVKSVNMELCSEPDSPLPV